MSYQMYDTQMTERVQKLKDMTYGGKPQLEAQRAVLITESYKQTEDLPIDMRRALALKHILENLTAVIRDNELIVGANTKAPRSSQVFPEFSYEWIEAELDTLDKRAADPFQISEEDKKTLREIFPYWKGKTVSDLALAYMTDETKLAMKHNVFTPGNYLYNGIGHVCVDYAKVLNKGMLGILKEIDETIASMDPTEPDYNPRRVFLDAAKISLNAAITFAGRYSKLAESMAKSCTDAKRRKELEQIAQNCARVPANPAGNFYEALQSFWFVQLIIQTESNGHSISPGRFDQYMYPFLKKDLESGKLTPDAAQELVDCVWIKLNEISKCRDAFSAAGFAGYGLFQNLCVGGQTWDGRDATNDMSFMCLQASYHTRLPQPSLSVRIWNKTPHDLLKKCVEVTQTGIGLPAYYNDEVIIPALINRGLTIYDAREYNLIGCVEPQKGGKTDGWHDAAFYNMCRPMEFVFTSGQDEGEQVGPKTMPIASMKTFEEFKDAYRQQQDYFIELMVNADNAIDYAHAQRATLPFLSTMIEDCIGRGKSAQCGGAVYNFTGPQGFGVANIGDGMLAVKKLVFEKHAFTLMDLKAAMDANFGKPVDNTSTGVDSRTEAIVRTIVDQLTSQGKIVTDDQIKAIAQRVMNSQNTSAYGFVGSSMGAERAAQIRKQIMECPKFGNDLDEPDDMAKEVAYMYTGYVEKFRNPRGGRYQAGLYPVSANVPLGTQAMATPDGRYARAPIADGCSPVSGCDVLGPTAAANSVAKLDHAIASNGTLFNQKFHPSALKGESGIEAFINLIRTYFDEKGSHVQFNVVSRETLLDAQKHPENYKTLVVRVAGYSALFTSLSKALQDDIINRTEQNLKG